MTLHYFKPRLQKLNSKGVAHFIVPLLVMVAIASIGMYTLKMSHAGTTDRLTPGTTMKAGTQLTSRDNGMKAVMQTDGNFVIYNRGGKAIWQTQTYGKGANRAVMQTDGNFVLYTAANKAVWNSGTYSHPGAYIAMDSSGDLRLLQGTKLIWHSNTYGKLGDHMYVGQAMNIGMSMTSSDGGMKLIMQSDGNLVLYNHVNYPVWNSRTNGKGGTYTIMQGDGNLVVYTAAGKPVWASGTNGRGGNMAVVQNDGNFVVYKPGAAVWYTGTNGKQTYKPAPPPTSTGSGSNGSGSNGSGSGGSGSGSGSGSGGGSTSDACGVRTPISNGVRCSHDGSIICNSGYHAGYSGSSLTCVSNSASTTCPSGQYYNSSYHSCIANPPTHCDAPLHLVNGKCQYN